MAKRAAADAPCDPLARRVSYLLRRVSASLMGDLAAALAKLGLRPVEASILVVIAGNPGCRQVEIGRMLGIKAANLAPLMGALVERGLVAKTPMDGRSQAVVLTTSGKAAARRAERAMDQLDGQVRDSLGDASVGELTRWLGLLLDRAAGEEGQAAD